MLIRSGRRATASLTLAALLLALALPGCGGDAQRGGEAPGEEQPGDTWPTDPHSAVFELRTTTCGTTNRRRAVAVAVSPTLLATVAHVFASADSFALERTLDGADLVERRAELIWLDVDRDLALVQLTEPTGHWLEPGAAAEGSPVGIVTVSDGQPVTTEGRILRHVSATLNGEGERAAIELEARIDQGDSGAPVVGPDGRLAGLVFAAARGDERGWAIDSSEIERALAAIEPDEPLALSC